MSFAWEPKWVRVKLDFAGTEIVTCRDQTTGLLVCPLCVNVDELCPEGKETNIAVENAYTFYTLEDLINHMATHGLSKFERRLKSAKEYGKGGK